MISLNVKEALILPKLNIDFFFHLIVITIIAFRNDEESQVRSLLQSCVEGGAL